MWNGVVAPKDMLAEIIDRLHKEIDADSQSISKRWRDWRRCQRSKSTPLPTLVSSSLKYEKWRTVIRAANIKVESVSAAVRYSIFSVTRIWRGRCLLVISGHFGMSAQCPLFPESGHPTQTLIHSFNERRIVVRRS